MTTAYLGIITILFASSVMKQHIPWWRNTESLLFGGYGGVFTERQRTHPWLCINLHPQCHQTNTEKLNSRPKYYSILTMTKMREQFNSPAFSHLFINCSHLINTHFLSRLEKRQVGGRRLFVPFWFEILQWIANGQNILSLPHSGDSWHNNKLKRMLSAKH